MFLFIKKECEQEENIDCCLGWNTVVKIVFAENRSPFL
jgi:hypothetical protein